MRLSFDEIQSEIKRVFMKYGLTEEKQISVQESTQNLPMMVFIHTEPTVLPVL